MSGTFHDLGLLEVPGFGPRAVRVYVPERADLHTRDEGPALFLFDGQNVFGDEGSFAGGWHAHDAAESLGPRTVRVPILVGLANGGEKRMDELTPWKDRRHGGAGGGAARFIDWIADRLVPRVRDGFAITPGPEGVFIGGSSLGGLASLYAHHRRPDVFGGALCMSSSLFWSDRRIFDWLEKQPVPERSRLYLDCGAREAGGRMAEWMKELVPLLRARGYGDDQLRVRLDPKGRHHESDWGRRLPGALRFLFKR